MDFPAANLTYRKLHSPRSEIRLLELQPADDIAQPPVCRLVNVKHTESLEFLAVSCLLSDTETERITINDKKTLIPASLGQLLRHIRAVFLSPTAPHTPTLSHPRDLKDSNRLFQVLRSVRSFLNDPSKGNENGHHKGRKGSNTVYVWVETLCLNHDDPDEMDHQYVHMATAYRLSQIVLGWLGPKDQLTDITLDLMQQMDEMMPPNWGMPEDRKLHPENYAPQHEWLAKLAHTWVERRESPYWHALLEFTDRSFFSRTWLVEEMAMARYPAFLIGDRLIPWRHVLILVRIIEELKDNKSVVFPGDMSPVAASWPLSTVYIMVSCCSGPWNWCFPDPASVSVDHCTYTRPYYA